MWRAVLRRSKVTGPDSPLSSQLSVKRYRATRLRIVLAGLIFLSLAARALTPAGYMPGSVADGTPFVLCPNSTPGAGYFLERRDNGHAHHQHHQGSDDTAADAPWEFCPFGVALTPGAPAADPLPPFLVPGHAATAAPVVILRAGPSRAFRARGPPLLAS